MCAAFDDGSLSLSLSLSLARSLAPSHLAPPLVKITALLATGYAVHLALSPPNPPPAPKTCIDNRTLFERAIRHVTFCTKMMTWVFVLADALVTLHLAFPSPLTRPLAAALLPSGSLSPVSLSSSSLSSSSLPHASLTHPLSSLAHPSPLLLLGAALATCGAYLRLKCFRALGSLFTFELTISPTHTLITSGPYALVRHPSYTGVYAVLVGASVVMLAPGAWLGEAWLRPSVCALVRGCVGVVRAVVGDGDLGFGVGVGAGLGRREGEGAAEGLGLGLGRGAGAGEGLCTVSAAGALLAWAFVAFWLTKVVYALKSTNKRLVTEDEELHRVFGTRWEEWAARVRWRLVPGVY